MPSKVKHEELRAVKEFRTKGRIPVSHVCIPCLLAKLVLMLMIHDIVPLISGVVNRMIFCDFAPKMGRNFVFGCVLVSSF